MVENLEVKTKTFYPVIMKCGTPYSYRFFTTQVENRVSSQRKLSSKTITIIYIIVYSGRPLFVETTNNVCSINHAENDNVLIVRRRDD